MSNHESRAHIRTVVVNAIAEHPVRYDVDAIVDELTSLAKRDGERYVDVPEMSAFWAVVEKHELAGD
jgi:hypothetical protein